MELVLFCAKLAPGPQFQPQQEGYNPSGRFRVPPLEGKVWYFKDMYSVLREGRLMGPMCPKAVPRACRGAFPDPNGVLEMHFDTH